MRKLYNVNNPTRNEIAEKIAWGLFRLKIWLGYAICVLEGPSQSKAITDPFYSDG